MDTALLDLVDVPFALLESDGNQVRWTNQCMARWYPELAPKSSLVAVLEVFDSVRAKRGLSKGRDHSVAARAPDRRGRERDVELRRRPVSMNGEALWLLEGLDQARAEVKQRLLDSHSKTIEINNRLLAHREQAIAQQSEQMRRLLDHMHDGMFVIDPAGRVGDQRSKACRRWFGDAEAPMAVDYLGGFDSDAAAWFEVAFEAVALGLLPLDFTIPQLPTKLERDRVHLALRYVPICTDDVLEHLLVIVSDVTAAVANERAKRHERDVVELTRRLLRDRTGLQQFFDEIDVMLESLMLGNVGFDDALRLLHTIKGNCALFGADAISSICHELESAVLDAGSPPTPDQLKELATDWDEIVGPIRRMMGVAESSVVELSDSELANFVSVIDHAGSSREVKAIALSWRNPPVRNMLTTLGEQAAGIASRLGKQLDVVIHDNNLRLPLKRWRPFWSSIVHVVRNAVDHGIESPETREANGKCGRGMVAFETEVVDDSIIVRVRDDGGGIDWERVARKRRERLGEDTPISHEALCEELFRSGFSTRASASELSGRGVGLGAAVLACRALGGEVTVTSELGHGSSFEFSFTDSRLAELARASQLLSSQIDSGLFVASESRMPALHAKSSASG